MLRRLFPTLAEWPLEKWMGVPVALLMLTGAIAGIFNIFYPSPVPWIGDPF